MRRALSIIVVTSSITAHANGLRYETAQHSRSRDTPAPRSLFEPHELGPQPKHGAPGLLSRQHDEAEKLLIRQAISSLLKDASSAEYRWGPLHGPGYTGCVNAKNSYGAYTGFQTFSVNLVRVDGRILRVVPENPTFRDGCTLMP